MDEQDAKQALEAIQSGVISLHESTAKDALEKKGLVARHRVEHQRLRDALLALDAAIRAGNYGQYVNQPEVRQLKQAQEAIELSKPVAEAIELERKELTGRLRRITNEINEQFAAWDLQEKRGALRKLYQELLGRIEGARQEEIARREAEAQAQMEADRQAAFDRSVDQIAGGNPESANEPLSIPLVPVMMPDQVAYSKKIAPDRLKVEIENMELFIAAIARGDLPGLDVIQLFAKYKPSVLAAYMKQRPGIEVPGVRRL